jgi:DNA repair protein RadA/Sms
MAKEKKVFVCQSCGSKYAKWVGKCTACNEWNTIEEEIEIKETPNRNNRISNILDTPTQQLDKIETSDYSRINTYIGELNNVLGGGLVPGSLTLLSGEPGVGKSTLLLQIAKQAKNKILYTSGEESPEQIKMRADRIGVKSQNCYILSQTNLEKIVNEIDKINPELVIIDSIQTIFTNKVESIAGTISQIRECANILMHYCKKKNLPIILIGHINKDGNIAGPKLLEHIVDTVLLFEGDKNFFFRILRANKNRFGSTNELGIFELRQEGLVEVENPSSQLVSSDADESLSGKTVAAMVEGIRPFLIETQALVSSAVYGSPQRSTTGFDAKRLNMLLAVLEKKSNFKLAAKDVFLNIAGGIKVKDTAIDLSVLVAILSSNLDISVPKNCCFAAEVGLSGETRPVSAIEQRINEAERFGMKKIFISHNQKGFKNNFSDIEVVKVRRVEEVFAKVFK